MTALRHGPWLAPPARASATTLAGIPVRQVLNDTGVWDTLIDTQTTGGNVGLTGQIYHSSAPFEEWRLSQWVYDLDVSGVDGGGFPVPSLPWPVGAVGYEYDIPNPDPYGVEVLLNFDLRVSWHLQVSDLGVDPLGVAVTMIATPVDLTGVPINSPPPGGVGTNWPQRQNVTHATLAGLPVIGSVAMPLATGSPQTFDLTTTEVLVSDYVVSADLVGGEPAVVRLALSFENMRTGVDIPANTERAVVLGGPADFTVTWQPPRYRFLYDVLPPLRQYPRDDALGGAPRNGKASTSTQHSARQGWKAAYR